MDIRELKDLLKNSTSVLMIEDGEPSYVILDYKVYRSLIQPKEQEVVVKNNTDLGTDQLRRSGEVEVGAPTKTSGLSAQEMEALERLNREIQALKDQIEQEERQGDLGGEQS